jgi:hypothetical protein
MDVEVLICALPQNPPACHRRLISFNPCLFSDKAETFVFLYNRHLGKVNVMNGTGKLRSQIQENYE